VCVPTSDAVTESPESFFLMVDVVTLAEVQNSFKDWTINDLFNMLRGPCSNVGHNPASLLDNV